MVPAGRRGLRRAGRPRGGLRADGIGVTVNAQSSAILSVLVLGAGIDYALLLVARYREELRRHEDRREAMALALRRAGPAIFASVLTVAAALLSLTLAQVNGTAVPLRREGRGRGPRRLRRVGHRVARTPRHVAVGATALLAVFAVGLLAYSKPAFGQALTGAEVPTAACSAGG